ncbi:AI-2E family transporter [Ovoidimarina sediminis]|uniref:AI-2E family transporter n=1 Tax=Ovoidimarina sediminis TaxID=3079856 RepID=UPI00290776A7|nr:AI-2E family transporter [Rhodophyticola sp. MJ-SS7]MDU8942469.1 AI-2E family transporter [Rhodophyticola sp. MJ-SS7]
MSTDQSPTSSGPPAGETPEPSGSPAFPSNAFAVSVGWAVIGLGLLALVGALAIARVFLVPVILAFLLALVFSPVCRAARRRGIPEPVTALGIVLLLLLGIFATTVSIAVPASGWIDDAPAITREVERKLRVLAGYAEAFTEAGKQIENAAESATGGAAEAGADEPVKVEVAEQGPLTTIALSAPLIVAQTVFVLILMFFVLASGSLFYERLVGVMPTFADKKKAIQIAYEIEREVSRYLLSVTTINAGLGLAIGIAMAVVGMPNPLAFGLLAFALNFIPFLGAIAGVAISFAVALVALPTAYEAFIVAAVYFSLTAIEGQLVTPWLVGRQLRLNTVVILIAVAFWAWLWSIMGTIMAVPLLVCVRVFCWHIPALQPFGDFLAGRDDRSVR